MASNYVQLSGKNGTIRINYDETANYLNQTSTINITSVQVMSTKNYQYNFYAVGIIKINNVTVLDMPNNGQYTTGWVSSPNTYYTISNTGGSRAVTVANNGKGSTTTISIHAYSGYNDFNIFCQGNVSGNIELSSPQYATISLTRYSTDSPSPISVPSRVVAGNDCLITINALKEYYLHTLEYSFDQRTWYPITPVGITEGTKYNAGTYTWKTSKLLDGSNNFFENESVRTCHLRCYTYDNGALLGTRLSTTSIYISDDTVIADIDVTPINENSIVQGWNNGNIFVQGYTKLAIGVTYSLPEGALLRSCKITINGLTVSDGVTSAYTTPSPVGDSGTVVVATIVTDSRGNVATSSKSVTVYPYSRPYASIASTIRFSDNPDIEDNESGTNISAKATIAYSSVNGNNRAGVMVRYKPSGDVYPTTYTELVSGAASHVKINGNNTLLTNQSYVVQFLIYDELHALSSSPTIIEVTIPTKAVILNARDGGDGFAIGGYNDQNAFQVWLKTILYDKLVLSNAMYGTSDPPTAGAEEGQVYFQLIE